MARAMSSLPVPLSPRISTGFGYTAARRASRITVAMAVLRWMSASKAPVTGRAASAGASNWARRAARSGNTSSVSSKGSRLRQAAERPALSTQLLKSFAPTYFVFASNTHTADIGLVPGLV